MEVVKTKNINILVCSDCWDPDQPQLQLGMYPVQDPQAVRNPRPDTTYPQSRALYLPVLNTNLWSIGQVGVVTVVVT